MTLVPQTGHVPDAALRPFLRVTTVPSNSRFALHFTAFVLSHSVPPFPHHASEPPRWAALSTMVALSSHLACKHPGPHTCPGASRTMDGPRPHEGARAE